MLTLEGLQDWDGHTTTSKCALSQQRAEAEKQGGAFFNGSEGKQAEANGFLK